MYYTFLGLAFKKLFPHSHRGAAGGDREVYAETCPILAQCITSIRSIPNYHRLLCGLFLARALINKFKPRTQTPWMLSTLSCEWWAKSCYLVSKETLSHAPPKWPLSWLWHHSCRRNLPLSMTTRPLKTLSSWLWQHSCWSNLPSFYNHLTPEDSWSFYNRCVPILL